MEKSREWSQTYGSIRVRVGVSVGVRVRNEWSQDDSIMQGWSGEA